MIYVFVERFEMEIVQMARSGTRLHGPHSGEQAMAAISHPPKLV